MGRGDVAGTKSGIYSDNVKHLAQTFAGYLTSRASPRAPSIGSGWAVIQPLITIRGVSQGVRLEHAMFTPETVWRTLEMCLWENSWGVSPDFKNMSILSIRTFLRGWPWASALKHCSSRAPIPE